MCHGKNNFIVDNFSFKGQVWCHGTAQNVSQGTRTKAARFSPCCPRLGGGLCKPGLSGCCSSSFEVL